MEACGADVAVLVQSYLNKSQVEVPDRSCFQQAVFVLIHIAAPRTVGFCILGQFMDKPPVHKTFQIKIFFV